MGDSRNVTWWHPHDFQSHVIQELETINRKLDKLMTASDDIAAAVTALQADETGLDASVQAIQAEIANLSAQGVDTTALNAEVANLQTHVAAVAALAPADTPPVDTTPAQ